MTPAGRRGEFQVTLEMYGIILSNMKTDLDKQVGKKTKPALHMAQSHEHGCQAQ